MALIEMAAPGCFSLCYPARRWKIGVLRRLRCSMASDPSRTLSTTFTISATGTRISSQATCCWRRRATRPGCSWRTLGSSVSWASPHRAEHQPTSLQHGWMATPSPGATICMLLRSSSTSALQGRCLGMPWRGRPSCRISDSGGCAPCVHVDPICQARWSPFLWPRFRERTGRTVSQIGWIT